MLKKFQWLLILTCNLFCGLVSADGFDEKYKTYSGDINSDGYADLYVVRPADIILLHGDIITPIVISPSQGFLLTQGPNQTFSLNSSPTPTELSVLMTWPESSVDLTPRDVNVDGKLDLFVSNFASDTNFSSGTYDQIVYAQNASALQVRAVDPEFSQFFEEVYSWMLDESYFERTAYANGWLDVETQEQTGWWYISYINRGYTYSYGQTSGLSILDSNDDPADDGNIPAYCGHFPSWCYYNVSLGAWLIYGTFEAVISVSVDYSNYNQDALNFSLAVGDGFDDPTIAFDANTAELILEGVLETQLGGSVAGLLLDPLPLPELPPLTEPVPKPRIFPLPLPDNVNNPAWFPDFIRLVLRRGPIAVCVLICSERGESDDWIIWRDFGTDWAIQDLLDHKIDEAQQAKAVIGEGQGNGIFTRVREAAKTYDAIYFSLGVDENGSEMPFSSGDSSPEAKTAFWYMNLGWLNAFIMRDSLFLDIGLYTPRLNRGEFYPCERQVLTGYPLRQEVNFDGNMDYSHGSCELW